MSLTIWRVQTEKHHFAYFYIDVNRTCISLHGRTFMNRFFFLKFSGSFPAVHSAMLSEGSC